MAKIRCTYGVSWQSASNKMHLCGFVATDLGDVAADLGNAAMDLENAEADLGTVTMDLENDALKPFRGSGPRK